MALLCYKEITLCYASQNSINTWKKINILHKISPLRDYLWKSLVQFDPNDASSNSVTMDVCSV